MPLTGAVFLMATLAVIGMPPFSLFQSEFLIVRAAFGGRPLPARRAVRPVWHVAIFAGFLLHIGGLVLGAGRERVRAAELACPWKRRADAGSGGRAGRDRLLAARAAVRTDAAARRAWWRET